MANKSKKGYNGTPHAKERRTRVIERLESQLKRGVKTPKKGQKTDDVPLLTDSDVTRIKKELETLKTRI